jgi:hypothetical protein
MISEWLKVMLEEIARKNAEAEQARAEERRRGGEEIQPNGGTSRPTNGIAGD